MPALASTLACPLVPGGQEKTNVELTNQNSLWYGDKGKGGGGGGHDHRLACWLFAETSSGGCDLLAVWLAQRQAEGGSTSGGMGVGQEKGPTRCA